MYYTKYEFLWPPRPEKAIPAPLLNYYEKKGYWAQFKKNGTANVIFVSPDKNIRVMSRHNEKHKAWSPTEKSSKAFKELPGKGWYVFNAELLHSKVSNIRDTNYIFDILVANGKYLIETTFEERVDIILNLFKVESECYSHYIINNNTWLAKPIKTNFKEAWNMVNDAKPNSGSYIDEGLVLKDSKAKLKLCNKKNSNSGWQVKCRVQHKNYGF